MRRSTTRTFVRRGRVRTDVKWATPSLISDQNVLASATLSATLLQDADWDSLITFDRATLLRIRGWIAVSQGTSSPATTGLMMAIWKMPQAVTVPQPTLNASYDLTDTLWTGGATWAASAATSSSGYYMPIDVKVKRKLDPEDMIVWAARCTTATAFCRVSGFLRCLWQYTKS